MYFLHFVIVVIGILCCNGQISNLNNFSPLTAGVDEIRAALAAGATCVDIIRLFQNRINRFNSQIQAIVTVNPRLMEIARERDSQKQQGKPLGSLHCVPVLISDNMDVEGLPTTVGSPAMADNIASGSSHGAEEMEHQGAVIVGKANMASFGDCQYQTRSSTGGLTRNPYDITRSPYGPSGLQMK